MEGTMYVMDHTGHRDVMRWSDSAASQAVAQRAFDEYKTRGYSMFVLDDDDKKGRKLSAFDPAVGAFIAVEALQGG
jgi:hypothetical protein